MKTAVWIYIIGTILLSPLLLAVLNGNKEPGERMNWKEAIITWLFILTPNLLIGGTILWIFT